MRIDRASIPVASLGCVRGEHDPMTPAARPEPVQPDPSGANGMSSPASAAERRVYALVGVPPEIQAYAMAKYSRSSQSMLESIREISAQRAEQFLNTFY